MKNKTILFTFLVSSTWIYAQDHQQNPFFKHLGKHEVESCRCTLNGIETSKNCKLDSIEVIFDEERQLYAIKEYASKDKSQTHPLTDKERTENESGGEETKFEVLGKEESWVRWNHFQWLRDGSYSSKSRTIIHFEESGTMMYTFSTNKKDAPAKTRRDFSKICKLKIK